MSCNNERSTVQVNQLESIAQVGGVRAYRIKRDTELATVLDVAEASLDVLQEVRSVGPHYARVIRGSARELVEAWRAETSVRAEHRVAVVAGDGAFEQLSDDRVAGSVIEGALRMADVEVDSNTSTGFVENEMGGSQVGSWSAYRAARDSVRRQPFETPWDKYAKFLDPMRFVDDEFIEKHNISDIDEVPAGRMPETVSLKTGIPFDVDRESDVDWWMAPAERTTDMVRWADEVVAVIDGEHVDKFETACDREGTPFTIAFELHDSVLRVCNESNDVAVRQHEIDDFEGVVGDGEVREGSPADLDTKPDGVHMNSAHADEEARIDRTDLDGADPGGKGVGSQSDRW